MHSATKYLGGHGDLLGGICIGSPELTKKVRLLGLRSLTGATLSPINAFLILRGLKTLKLRMERHSQSAMSLAEAMAGHPAIDRLDYPGLPGFPGHALAKKQMSGFGGMISLELKGGMKAGVDFMKRLKLVTRAVSLGDAVNAGAAPGLDDALDLHGGGTRAARHRRTAGMRGSSFKRRYSRAQAHLHASPDMREPFPAGGTPLGACRRNPSHASRASE